MAIEINCDMGEAFGLYKCGDDEGIMPYITMANVACGFHAGDSNTMRAACEAAVGVAIGAHVSYRDREGFGRRELGVDAATIEVEAAEQIAALQEISGGRVAYVKPHGALYHRASCDDACAAALVAAGKIEAPGKKLSLRQKK